MFHVKHSVDDTIVAIATPVGVGGVGVVRISGDQSIRISEKIIRNFPKNVEPQHVYHGWVVCDNKPVDEVLYYYMKAPNSYTGEDIVEISGHGCPIVLREILELVIQAGGRLAEPGEFTKRAFLNGKIDLLQAEAVIDLVLAKTRRACDVAASQLAGDLSFAIKKIRGELLKILTEIEGEIDFSEEVDEIDPSLIFSDTDMCLAEIERLLETAEEGKILREGVRTVIIGRPNVGKSSLLNALLGEERAIVTESPGTTRDSIEEVVNSKGLPLIIVDTAGIRHPRDKAEEFGIVRTRRELEKADLVLVVLDASQSFTAEDAGIIDEVGERRGLLVLNKVDLGCRILLNGYENRFRQVKVSALKGEGLEELRQEIFVCLSKGRSFGDGGRTLINSRHREALLRARDNLIRAREAARQSLPLDFVAMDLKAAVVALGEISGEEVSEEVLNAIFERFCIGK